MYQLAGSPGSYEHYLIWTTANWNTSFILEEPDLEDFDDYVEANRQWERVLQNRAEVQLTPDKELKLRFVYGIRLLRNLSFDL